MSTKYIRPAGMGDTCDSWYPNPAYQPGTDLPQLVRCYDPASYRITLQDDHGCYDVKRCLACRDELHRQVERGATFEILSEDPMKEFRNA